MKRLPKGQLKVVHINRKAIGENETRVRATLGEPRRLVPVVTVWTKDADDKPVKIEGFGVRIKGEVLLNYDITRFTPGHEFGTPDVRCWLQTESQLEIAESVGELTKPEPAAPVGSNKDQTNG